MIKLFLDTNIILSSLIADRKAHISCLSILLQNNIALVTNEYGFKEVRKILVGIYSNDQEDVNRFIEFLRAKMEIVKTPSKEEIKKINSKDRSDRPIIFSTQKHQCVLISDDRPTRNNADKYVLALGSSEAIDFFNIRLAKEPFRSKKRKSYF